MIHHLRGNAVAYLALFVALGGVSWAAVKLPKNSVGANQIKTNAVGSAEVKNRSLLARDFRTGQLPQGPLGPAGPTGPRGLPGQPGTPGQPGADGVTWAEVGGDGTQDPAASPEGGEPTGARRYAFTTPVAGRVLLEWRGRMSVNCTVAPGNIGIYIDGTAVADSGRDNSTLDEVSTVGLTQELAAGAHVAHIRVDCPNGDANSVSAPTATAWSAVLFGS